MVWDGYRALLGLSFVFSLSGLRPGMYKWVGTDGGMGVIYLMLLLFG